MPKIILDTNVIVSGLVFGGKIRKILDLVYNGDLELVICDDLKKETLRILVEKFAVDFEDLKLTDTLLKVAKNYELQKPYPKISRDKNDDYLLALIKKSEAKLLITGDKDLLVLQEFLGCRIIKPSQFLDKLSQK